MEVPDWRGRLPARCLGVLAVGSNAFGAGPAFAQSMDRQRAATQTGGVGARNTIWFSATNIADPYYIFGVTGMKAAASLFGLKTQLVGPPTVDYAAQVQSFTTLLADPSTLGIRSLLPRPQRRCAPVQRSLGQRDPDRRRRRDAPGACRAAASRITRCRPRPTP